MINYDGDKNTLAAEKIMIFCAPAPRLRHKMSVVREG